MRAYVPGYEMLAPKALDEALGLLAASPETLTPIAGGTDLMVLFECGRLPEGRYLSLWQLDELRGIDITDEFVTLGALTTYRDVRDHPLLQAEFPMLCAAAAESGAIAIQNRGTLGGNIINASPAADSPPALLAYDAEIELVKKGGARWVPYRGFHLDYKVMDKEPGELLRRVRLPRRKDEASWTHFYRKVGTRRYQAISKVCFAGLAQLDSKGAIKVVRIGLASVAPTVLAAVETETALIGQTPSAKLAAQARAAMAKDVTPIDDIRSTAEYRRHVSINLAGAFVDTLSG